MANGVYFLFAIFLHVSWSDVSCAIVNATEVFAVVSTESVGRRDANGSLIIYADIDQKLLFIGQNFSNLTEIRFTSRGADRGVHCEENEEASLTEVVAADTEGLENRKANFIVNLRALGGGQSYYFVCVKQEELDGDTTWIHQGQDILLRLAVDVKVEKTTFLPLWLQITFVCFLLCLSGLFSGLNLGLMALDKTELKIIEKCGSPNEKKYAKVISPLRKRGNFLLCTLLLGNVLVNNSLTILLDDITNGLIAVIGATIFIVIFGEIIPQAICSRHGLAVGARTRYITYVFMLLTFPLSFPISLLLDKILGEEIGQVYNREKLQELIRVTKDFKVLDDDEVNIISGALSLSKKTVTDIMTRIEDVYMLEYNDILDFEKMSEIMKRGYSRIPVYENDKSNIVALLNIKDLALIDPDDKTALKTVCKFYQHHLIFVFDDHKLDQMLQDFRQGHSHMAIVRRVNNEGDGDPYYETLGVVTLEDVIEEIIQSEIIDETDTLCDNKEKAPRMLPRQDFSVFIQPDDMNQHTLTPQHAMAAFQFLSTSVEPFLDKYISEAVLKKLIKQNIVVELNPNLTDKHIYKEDVPCDYFILILQGHVEVSVGREKMVFQGGPFTYYGVPALKLNETILAPSSGTDTIYIKHEPFVPDFSMKAQDNLLFLKIKRSHYIVARRATQMGRSQTAKDEEAFSSEWRKVAQITGERNRSSSENIVELHCTNDGETASPSKPRLNDANWSSVPSNASMASVKRTDSKDSGWSFPASDKQADTSEGSAEAIPLKLNTSFSKGNSSDAGEVTPLCSRSMKAESGDKARTNSATDSVTENCDNCSGNDSETDEHGSGEFTPLVTKDQSNETSQSGGVGS